MSRSRRIGHAWIGLMAVFSLAMLLGENGVWAQGKPTGGGKNAGQKNSSGTQPPDDLKIDSVSLPKDYQPPPEKLAIMDLDMPLATKDEMDKIKKEFLPKYFKVRNEVDTSEAAKKVVEKSIRYKLGNMTLRDQLPNLPALHKRFMEETTRLETAGKRKADLDALNETTLKEIVKQIPELFKNNFYVRLHAVLILSELDYAPAFEPLLLIIQAKDIKDDPVNGQPEAVKIAATMGLIRITRFTVPLPKERSAIAHAVVGELLKQKTHWWYQLRLIEVLRYCDNPGVDAVNNNKPFVIDALLAVIKDPGRSWIVRAKACYALGRVPLPPSVRAEDVVHAVGDFALQLSNAAAANPKNPAWKGCFWDLYLAFHASDNGKEKDLDAERKSAGGFLTRIKSIAQPIYTLVVPIVNDILNDKPPNAGNVQKLETFLRGQGQNLPAQNEKNRPPDGAGPGPGA